MDEAPEFAPHLLESLRTPLEEGEVRLARTDGQVRYPAKFQLVMAANPCPCAPRTTATAGARRRPGEGTWAGCRVRCSTGSTCGPRWIR
jgi:predicted ATPase with chaperone activity